MAKEKGGHGNMITGLKYRIDPNDLTQTAPVIVKLFKKGEDDEMNFYKKVNELANPNLNIIEGAINRARAKKKKKTFKKLNDFMPKWYSNKGEHHTWDTLDKKLFAPSDAFVELKEEKNLQYLVLEDSTFKNGYQIDLKMGTRRFDSNAIDNHNKCVVHKKGKTKVEIQLGKREDSEMIKKYGVNIVAGVAPYSESCVNKEKSDKKCIMGDQNSKKLDKKLKENTREKVKRSLFNVFLPKDKYCCLREKLTNIKTLFEEDLKLYGLHFFGSSLFITLSDNLKFLRLKMIDFAHVEASPQAKYPFSTGFKEFKIEKDINKLCKNKNIYVSVEENAKDTGYILGLNTLLGMIDDEIEKGSCLSRTPCLQLKLKF